MFHTFGQFKEMHHEYKEDFEAINKKVTFPDHITIFSSTPKIVANRETQLTKYIKHLWVTSNGK